MASSAPSPDSSAPAPDSGRLQGNFLKIAALTVLIYAVLAFFYNTPALSHPRLNKEILVWPVTFGLLWAYWQGTKAIGQGRDIPARWILLPGLLLAILALLTPPFHSTDMFGYVNRGWQQVHYHMNPYVYTVDAIPNWQADPMITDHWVNNPSPYGFLYLLIAKGLCLLGQGNRALTLTVFKLGNLVMHLLTAGLVWLGAKHLNNKPGSPTFNKLQPVLALYLYLWNPLVLINTLANGHNDIYMGFFVMLSALFAVMGSWVWMLPALMAATLIKYGAVVIFPIAGLFLIKNKAWKALGIGTMAALGIFGITGIPFLPDWQQFHLSEINHNAFVSHGSIHSMIFTSFKTLSKEVFPAWYPFRETVRSFLKNSLLLGYALFFVGLCWKRLRQSEYTALGFVRDALLVMSVLVCFVSLKFYPWYFGMFFPLALLLPEGDVLRRWVLVVSGAQLFAITFIGQAHMLNFVVMTGLPTAWVLWQTRKEAQQKASCQSSIPGSAAPLAAVTDTSAASQ